MIDVSNKFCVAKNNIKTINESLIFIINNYLKSRIIYLTMLRLIAILTIYE